MKDIGLTPDGNHIVEMGPQEHTALAKLRFFAVDGGSPNSFWAIDPGNRPIDADLTNPLIAVLQWVLIKGNSIALREAADEIDSALQEKKE